MTRSVARVTGYYQYAGSTGGRGLTEARIVDAQTAANPTEDHADGSFTVTFSRTGRTMTYRPATPDDVAAIMAENGARIDGNARLGKAVAAALRAAGVQMARYMQRDGSGVYVHVGGSWVSVWWWYATEQERRTAPAPWIDGESGVVRTEVVAALLHAGFRFTDKGSDLELTYEKNPQV
ncbi:hypothetical protein ABZ896_22795 [Streptomyces sp. NPDC047072]|uniref:hypothetical protein n=1 Tax=Streptomyces sp. NPDC047072 TaxID=3154809 RepID=UPI0033EC78A1